MTAVEAAGLRLLTRQDDYPAVMAVRDVLRRLPDTRCAECGVGVRWGDRRSPRGAQVRVWQARNSSEIRAQVVCRGCEQSESAQLGPRLNDEAGVRGTGDHGSLAERPLTGLRAAGVRAQVTASDRARFDALRRYARSRLKLIEARLSTVESLAFTPAEIDERSVELLREVADDLRKVADRVAELEDHVVVDARRLLSREGQVDHSVDTALDPSGVDGRHPDSSG